MPKILSQNGVMTPSRKNQRSRTQKSTIDHTTDADTDHTVEHAADKEAPHSLGAIKTLPKGSTDVKLQFMYQYMYLNFEFVKQRFADMNKRFEDMNKRFTSLQWFIGIIVGLGAAVLAALIALFRSPIQ